MAPCGGASIHPSGGHHASLVMPAPALSGAGAVPGASSSSSSS